MNSRVKGTIDNPIIVNGAGDEQYAGCTGYPADSHQVNWLTVCRTESLHPSRITGLTYPISGLP